MKKTKLPELLSPAGSPEAFLAAIDGGADAIYVGGASFNARINAKNFSRDDIADAIKLAHMYGVKVYQTVNIMVLGRELKEFISNAEYSAAAGIDAFIVSDIGASALLRKYLPEVPLHGSTQMSVHNSAGARALAEMGFSRVVPAREMSRSDIRSLVENNPLEVEIFVHGAMCVSHSGQCLFSSLVGGRSGNRGLCAQPCRLPYSCADGRVGDRYPLSLKDMSLAEHINEITGIGVASLKIEGRMKSPEYVLGVTKIWRRLLDEGRNATKDDICELSELFSRGGFSDGYYTENIGRKMLGVRSESDKQASRDIEKFNKIHRKVPVSMKISLEAEIPSKLTLFCKDKQVTVEGDCPQNAINAPIDGDTVKKCMAKLGDSCFALDSIDIDIRGSIMMPISGLNALRRLGVAALEKEMTVQSRRQSINKDNIELTAPSGKTKRRRVGRFYLPEQITDRVRQFFDVILLPLDRFAENSELADGFVMPPVIFDSQNAGAVELLKRSQNAKYAVVSNLGQTELIKTYLPHTEMIADFRLNIGNNETLSFFERSGFESMVVSPELTLPQIRDIKGAKAAIVYGRIPLMTLEKCVIKELYGDRRACEVCSRNEAEMKDRRGFIFPVIREYPHRNIVLNSVPTQMSDRLSELEKAGIYDMHFIFTVEKPVQVDRVIEDYEQCRSPFNNVRRI